MVSVTSEALFGRQRDRTRLALGVATAMFLCTFLIATHARGRWMQTVMEKPIRRPVTFVVVVGGGVAMLNAYWNEGLLLSWLLVFSLVTPWLIHYNLQFGIYHPAVSAGYVTLALLVSTVGYLAGVGVWRLADDETGGGLVESASAIVGVTPARTPRWFLLLGGLFVIPAILVYVAEPLRSLLLPVVYPVVLLYPIGDLTGGTVLGIGVFLGWIGVATWPAYRGNGLLVSWAVVFAPVFGTLLSYSIVEDFFASGFTPFGDVLIAAEVSVVFSAILGAVGFLAGVVIRATDTPR